MLLITGGKGQLGTTLAGLVPDAIVTDSSMLDITDTEAVCGFVDRNHVDVIVNCAAYTAVDKAEDEPEVAERVNVIGPANLAKTGAALIHISTDYVFDGLSRTPYTEEMPTNPLSVYGWTKLRGEMQVLENAPSSVVIRTGWLYSNFGNNFVKTILRLGAERECLKVVEDQIGTPTSCHDLSKAIVGLLPRVQKGAKGVYHYSNDGFCSWYEFAEAIIRLTGLSCRVDPTSSKDYPGRAKRPGYSVLNKTKFTTSFGLTIPHWKESLDKCLRQF